MQRIASHYIYCGRPLRLHYAEIDDRSCLAGIYPLTEEKAGVAFYGGILIILSGCPAERSKIEAVTHLEKNPAYPNKTAVFAYLAETRLTDDVHPGMPVTVFLLNGIPLASSEFGADDRRCDSHVQRL